MDESQRLFFRGAAERMLAGHRELRAQLAGLRAALAGEALPLTAQLRMRCLSYCQGLHEHHTKENGAFPRIEEAFPELAPVLARLRREHTALAQALGRAQALLAGETRGTAERAREELERAIAGLEEHFAVEERELLSPLGVPAPSGTP